MRLVLFWLLGVPAAVILLLAGFSRHIESARAEHAGHSPVSATSAQYDPH
jgi:hypothetical protein